MKGKKSDMGSWEIKFCGICGAQGTFNAGAKIEKNRCGSHSEEYLKQMEELAKNPQAHQK